MTNKETELACLSIITSLANAAKAFEMGTKALEMAAGMIKKIHHEAAYPNLKVVKNEVGRALAKELNDTKGEEE